MGERAGEDKPGGRIRVALVDDHTMLRHGLRQTLLEHGFEIVGEASNGRAGAELALELKPDVVVMDLEMPQMNGIEATRRIIEREPGARILMLTISTEDEHVLDALAAGACGYVVKTASPEETVRAIRTAHAGDSTLSPQVATRLVERLRTARDMRSSPAAVNLTPRELEILRLIVDGRENAEIADILVISLSTAKNHVAHVLDKLGTENRVQAAVYAVRNGLV